MWLSSKIFSILEVSKDSVDTLRADLASLRAERDLLRTQLTVANTNAEWFRMKINQLEVEKTTFMQKAYNVQMPIPEIIRPLPHDSLRDPKTFSFEDIGDELAGKFGLQTYIDK